MAEHEIDLEQELDHLYSRPAGEFVAARNELAKRLRSAGDRDSAGRIKKLPRPSLTAWAVNQLAFRAAAALASLAQAGERVKAAHLAGPKEQQAAAKARRDAISTLRTVAEVALQEAGTRPARSHRQRISRTLEALSSHGEGSGQPRAGRLSTDLEPAGFDALTDLAAALAAAQQERPRPGKRAKPLKESAVEAQTRPPAKPEPKPKPKPKSKVVEHPAARREAERKEAEQKARQEAERQARESAAAARKAAERAHLDRQRDEARKRLEQVEEKVSGLREETERTASELDRAKKAEAELAEAAREAERQARQARARAEAAAGVTAKARLDAEAASGARRRAESEIDKAREELERAEAARDKLDA